MDSTKVFVDSIKAVVSYSSEVPVVKQESHANWADVAIVAIISFSVIVIIGICVFGYKCIKKQENDFLLKSDKEKRESEKNDKKIKQDAEILDREYRRKIELEDREYKRNQGLITQRLDFLKELCYEYKNIREVCEDKVSEKTVKVLKDSKSEDIELYISELDKVLEITDMENNAEISNNEN